MTINYLAILVSAIALMIVGWLWYGLFFRKIWSKQMGFDNIDPAKKEAMMQGMGWSYFQQFIAALVTSWVLAMFISMYVGWRNTTGLHAGLLTAFLAWLGFYLPVKWGDKIWGGKSWTILWIDLSHTLVGWLIAGIILGLWK